MNKLDVAQALEIAEHAFPQGPEELAQVLGARVHREHLDCDGWCLQNGYRSIIRINTSVAATRQRFTLAHELGHLILEIPSQPGEKILSASNAVSKEERRVNKLASQILLPSQIIKGLLKSVPVTATSIREIAKVANVSELVVALRLTNMSEEIGLKGALVAFYKNDTYTWQWSPSLRVDSIATQDLLAECSAAHPNPARTHRPEQQDVIVASLLENPYYDFKVVFLQVVNETIGLKKLDEERVRELEEYLYQGIRQLRPRLEGRLGHMAGTVKGLTAKQALIAFNNRYFLPPRREHFEAELLERLETVQGQEYLLLRLKKWI